MTKEGVEIQNDMKAPCLALTGVPGEPARWGGFEGEVAVRRTDGEGAI